MRNEKYWKKALEQTCVSIKRNSLHPIETQVVTTDFYDKHDFVIRKRRQSVLNFKNPSSFFGKSGEAL